MPRQNTAHSCVIFVAAIVLSGCPLPTDTALEPEKMPTSASPTQVLAQSTLAIETPSPDIVSEPSTEPTSVDAAPNANSAHVSTLAGTDEAGDSDGEGDSAGLSRPGHLKWGGDDIIFFVDTANHRVRKLDLETNEVATVAGNTGGNAEGSKENAKFSRPQGIAVGDDVIFVADTNNHVIRKIDLSKEDTDENFVTTLAGDGTAGFLDGDALDAQFNEPRGLALDEDLNQLYVADTGNHSIRAINLSTFEVSTLAGDAPASDAEEAESGYEDDVATAARFTSPFDVALSPAGDILYVADYGNHRIRKIDVIARLVTTLAGDGEEGFLDGRGKDAQFRGPVAMDTDSAGNVWVADRGNHRIRKINQRGFVTTEVGTGAAGDTDDVVSDASIKVPGGILAMSQLVYFTTDTKIKLVQFP